MRVLTIFLLFMTSIFAVQIKDVANTVGVRDNQLIGYGLVVGLNGSGDGTSSKFTLQSISNLLQGMNIKVDPNDIKSKIPQLLWLQPNFQPLQKAEINLILPFHLWVMQNLYKVEHFY